MTEAVFARDGARFVPTRKAGSPWGDDVQHGGPPAGLLARAIERFAASEEMRVVRLTVDLFRPVPMGPLEVTVHSVREGRRIHIVDAVIVAGGVEVSRASGLLLRTSEVAILPSATALPPRRPGPADRAPPAEPRLGDRPRRQGFHTAAEMRRLPRAESGAAATWIRVPELVDGERMTPLVRLASTCDFVNAVASMAGGPRDGVGFINTDSTVYVHRPPAGEWLCLQVERALEPDGLGVSDAIVFDEEGPVARATQAVLANRMT
jgi:hypothetical protein